MRTPHLALILLLAGCFSLALLVGPRMEAGARSQSGDLLGNVLGESRKLFADRMYVRSDVYFHSGYYPSLFDQAAQKKRGEAGAEHHEHDANCQHAHGNAGHKHDEKCQHSHSDAGHKHDEKCSHGHESEGHQHSGKCSHGEGEHERCSSGGAMDFLGKPKDPMDAFTRNFFMSRHTHLTDQKNGAREILPWLQLAAKLDPAKIESYTVGAYWLRDLGRHEEAELWLRQGLRKNPDNHELLYEVASCHFGRGENERARNLLELACQRWREVEGVKPAEQQNRLVIVQILLTLARIEERFGHREKTLAWLGVLKNYSASPGAIEQRIAEVRAGKPLEER
jgi:tetratricopeptide (TPR) repeat protein